MLNPNEMMTRRGLGRRLLVVGVGLAAWACSPPSTRPPFQSEPGSSPAIAAARKPALTEGELERGVDELNNVINFLLNRTRFLDNISFSDVRRSSTGTLVFERPNIGSVPRSELYEVGGRNKGTLSVKKDEQNGSTEFKWILSSQIQRDDGEYEAVRINITQNNGVVEDEIEIKFLTKPDLWTTPYNPAIFGKLGNLTITDENGMARSDVTFQDGEWVGTQVIIERWLDGKQEIDIIKPSAFPHGLDLNPTLP